MSAKDSALEGLRDDVSGRPARDVLVEIARVVEAAGSLLITTHVNPDGDAIGSAVGLALGLRRLGKTPVVAHGQAVPDRLQPFVPEGLVELADDAWLRRAENRFDGFVVLDTSEPERVGPLENLIFAGGRQRLCLDHHVHEARGLFDHHLVVREVPATASLVIALLDELGVSLDTTIARALWLGLSTDTGWFRFSNTTPLALIHASRLLALGLETEALHEEIYGAHSLERTRLLGAVLQGLQSDHDGRFVWGFVDRELLPLDGVIDHLKSIRGALVVALITETDKSCYKVSLRSMREATVEALAGRFGGGGHPKAAGFRFQGSLPALEDNLRRLVPQGFSGTPSPVSPAE
ncbi:MAG: bifunctional oligoribonuclease/PAP phosphatase NrnA [Planctomycetota bacterium]|nr:bifunctional oligoribonuclease/PAP phosphatase NrnA [Planctomycetota bacterium]